MNRSSIQLFLLICTWVSLTLDARAQSRELPLRTGDPIGIQISGIPAEEAVQISHMYRVSEQGTINLLYLDAVTAAGVKPSELEKRIAQLYRSKEIYTHPSVSINVDAGSEARPVFISGAVAKPGMISYRDRLTVAKAISSAGGGTAFARLSKVELRRNGKTIGILNLTKASKGDGETPVEPDDEIIVPD